MENENKALSVVNNQVSNPENETEKETPASETVEAEYKEAPAPAEPAEGLKLSMDAELFAGMRQDFDSTLRVLLGKVTSRNIEEGEVNLKLVIGLAEQSVMDKKVYVPSFKYVVTGNYKEKVESKGTFGVPQTYLSKGPDGNYELKSLQPDLFSKEPQEALFKEAADE